MNNNIFQINRVGMLIRRTFQQYSKIFLSNALVLAGIPILLLLLDILASGGGPSLSSRSSVLAFLAGGFIILSPFAYYNFYNHPKKGLSEVMLPASVLEKFVVMQFVCMIYVPLMVLVFFGGIDAILTTLFPKYQTGYAIVELFNNKLSVDGVLLVYLTLQFVFFCNLFFVRRKQIKTAVSYMVVNLLGILILVAVLSALESSGYFDGLSGSMSINPNNRGLFEFYKGDHTFITSFMIFRIFMELVMPIVFMVGSYRIMKTKRY